MENLSDVLARALRSHDVITIIKLEGGLLIQGSPSKDIDPVVEQLNFYRRAWKKMPSNMTEENPFLGKFLDSLSHVLSLVSIRVQEPD